MKQATDQTAVQVVQNAIEQNNHLEGALLPILHQIRDELGYIPSDHVKTVAEAMNLSRAEVHGVISFYHTFSYSPTGTHVIEVCRAESCQARGGRTIEATLKEKLGIDYKETTEDGRFTLEDVYCLGNCACSPSVRVGNDIYGRLTSESAASLVDAMQDANQKEHA